MLSIQLMFTNFLSVPADSFIDFAKFLFCISFHSSVFHVLLCIIYTLLLHDVYVSTLLLLANCDPTSLFKPFPSLSSSSSSFSFLCYPESFLTLLFLCRIRILHTGINVVQFKAYSLLNNGCPRLLFSRTAIAWAALFFCCELLLLKLLIFLISFTFQRR